jgi:hypothetical protein
MTARLSISLSLALAAAPVLAFAADHAHMSAHGGGGSHGGSGGGSSSHGGSSGGSGGGHPSGGGSGYHAVPRGSGGSSASGAELRHPRAGTGRYYSHGHGYYPYYGYGYGYGYYPYYWGGYYSYDPYFYGGYYPSYGGYSYSGPYDRPYYEAPEGAVRLIVEPDSAKVYVDGYYSGVVDDFDGLFQHLDLPMGKHEMVLRLDGYQTQRLKIYVTPGETLKIHHTLVKGSGEAPTEIVAGDPSVEKYPARLRDERAESARPPADGGEGADDDDDEAPPSARVRMSRPPAPRDDGATLRLNVVPSDASVYVDGSFHGTARDVRRLDLPPGTHKVEVVRPGYRTYEKDVAVDADKATEVDVTLER